MHVLFKLIDNGHFSVFITIMLEKQTRYQVVLHKAMLIMSIVWSFFVLDFVYAEGQNYIYASDIIKKKKNIIDERENWRYKHEIPLKYQDKPDSSPIRYKYLPPSQKPGSNPITDPQRIYQSPSVKPAERSIYESGKQYNYPPSRKKPGTNPFIRPRY